MVGMITNDDLVTILQFLQILHSKMDGIAQLINFKKIIAHHVKSLEEVGLILLKTNNRCYSLKDIQIQRL